MCLMLFLMGPMGVMLSAETASGNYPIEAVQMMVRIALEIEAGDSTACQPQCQHLTQEHAVSQIPCPAHFPKRPVLILSLSSHVQGQLVRIT